MSDSVFAEAAFGDEPGRWPLPSACTAEQLWLRAVAAGGQGRYSSARADLQMARRGPTTVRQASLLLTTHASFLRQLGWHRLARGWDGKALAVALAGPINETAEARADAFTGLAADALGIGRLAASAVLLERASIVVARAGGPPRLAIRLAWVSAELAMASGDGDSAVWHAERAVELVGLAAPALRRHQVKSEVVLAAALCCAGVMDRSREVADDALAATDRYGLIPLRWALASLLSGIGSNLHTPQVVAEIQAQSADFVARHGGQWNGR
jgi:hypothetical protein